MSDLTRMHAAADWLVRLNDAPADETVVTEWLKWCEGDPENLPAFKRAQAIWQAAIPPADSRHSVHSIQKFWVGVAAASILLGLSALWIVVRHGPDPGTQSYSTPIAGRGLSVLPDGSKVELSAGSRITTQYSSTSRAVTVDAGEAFFSVSKDTHRPFVVTAGGLTVIAVGTAFNVRRGDDRIIVAVQEGRVRVSDRSLSGPDLAAVGAGEQVVYRERLKHLAVAHIEPQDAASWREGVLKYEQEPLSSVAADLNRYTSHRIVIRDRATAQLPFTGTIFSTRIDDALNAFIDVFPVTIVKNAETIEIRPR